MALSSTPKAEARPQMHRLVFFLTICLSLRVLQLIAVMNDRFIRQVIHVQAAAFVVDLATTVLEAVTIVLICRFFLTRPQREARAAEARSERRYRCLAEDAADFIFTIDRTAPDRLLASSVSPLLGFAPDDASPLSLLSIIHEDDRALARRAFASLSKSHPRKVMTLRMRHAHGHLVWVDAMLRRVDHGTDGFETIVMVRDVTARQHEAEELRSATQMAQRAKAEADEANEAKTEFLACMSHEIRTPLHSVVGFASLLLNNRDLSPDVRLYGERIQAGGKALLTVVNDILDFSRVEARAVDLKQAPFALFNLVDECLSIVRKEATTKSLSLNVSIPAGLQRTVTGDEARLRQVLLNLLYNAIKFTHVGSVCLEIRELPGHDERIRFAIVDTGIGIGPDDLPRLFQRFIQVDGSMRRTYGGTGLGLAISKGLVELMDGTIGVESEKGVGSTFWFSLPLPRAEAVVETLATPRASPAKARRILLVEDVRLNQELIQVMLQNGQHQVDIVSNGAEAVMAVSDCDYDLVLMDLQMPFIDGFTATRLIRELPQDCRHVPIVAMTANVLPEAQAMARDSGMADVLLKPFTLAELDELFLRLEGRTGSGRSVRSEPETLVKLKGLLGEEKVRQLLTNLADSVEQRFLSNETVSVDRANTRRQAHASVAGCGMLGFSAFAQRCRELEHCSEEDYPLLLSVFLREASALCCAVRSLTETTTLKENLPSAA